MHIAVAVRRLVFALLLVLFTRPAHAVLTTISPIINDPATGNRYQLLSNGTWTDSEVRSRALGGDLATITTKEEQDFVFKTFGDYANVQRILWIGLYDPTHDQNGKPHASNFVWASGAPITYTNWDVGEPNSAGGVEFYAALYYPNFHNPGSWNDWSDRTADPIGVPFHGVVEYVPEPSSFGMVFVALIPIMRWKRR
jgi:hypothetical protein